MNVSTTRHQFLDIAKGLAIILVVVGHVIQGSSEKFDDLLWFRVIYSFHMPLFVFLSGSVAAIAFSADEVTQGVGASITRLKTRLSKAAFRLLLPFISWCVVNQLVYHQSDSIWSAVLLAFRRPDTALWFLLAIFYCVAIAAIFNVIFSAIYEICKKIYLIKIANWISDGRVQIVAMILIWWAIREHTPRGAGLSLIRPYFIYYLLGIGFYKYLYTKLSLWIYLVAWPIFIGLIPFWSRTATDNFTDLEVKANLPEILVYIYAGWVALSGVFMVIGLAKRISITRQNPIKSFLILCGQLSLGIYAIHYFLLQYAPAVLAPLILSLLIAYLIKLIPIFRNIFLGER